MSDSTESKAQTRTLTGRRNIYLNASSVTDGNVVKLVKEALIVHTMNAVDADYLWKYYKGVQPILLREKEVRPSICNKVVENHAKEAVDFKVGYQLFEPVQYVSRARDERGDHKEHEDELAMSIKRLNDMMFASDKASHDRELFEKLAVSGVCCRLVLPVKEPDEHSEKFAIYELDPRSSFVARTMSYDHKVLFGAWIGVDDDDKKIVNVYTDDFFYVVKDNAVVEKRANTIGRIPIIEYELNTARMGCFEPALPILDAINAVESNRLDGIEQTVQALYKFVNCDVDETTFEAMLQLGAVKVKSTEGMQGDVDVIVNDLDQTQTQVTKDDLYTAFMRIVGMPVNNGVNSSTSDTGTAVLLRDGWTFAESHAKAYELKFKRSEREMLRVLLTILDGVSRKGEKLGLKIRDIDMAFNRRNYENALIKSQVLTTMLSQDKIDPILAFQQCGFFNDPQAAYLQSMAHYEKTREENLKLMQEQMGGQAAVGGLDTKTSKHRVGGSVDGAMVSGMNEHNRQMMMQAAARHSGGDGGAA